MIEVMNMFQAMFIFNKNTKPAADLNRAEIELAIALKNEALELAAVAEREMENGAATRALAAGGKTAENRRVFAEIAVWHYRRAADKYGKAANRFDEAGRVYAKKIRAFQAKARRMRERAAQAETALASLDEFLIKH